MALILLHLMRSIVFKDTPHRGSPQFMRQKEAPQVVLPKSGTLLSGSPPLKRPFAYIVPFVEVLIEWLQRASLGRFDLFGFLIKMCASAVETNPQMILPRY